jgi:hypothetical protein
MGERRERRGGKERGKKYQQEVGRERYGERYIKSNRDKRHW